MVRDTADVDLTDRRQVVKASGVAIVGPMGGPIVRVGNHVARVVAIAKIRNRRLAPTIILIRPHPQSPQRRTRSSTLFD